MKLCVTQKNWKGYNLGYFINLRFFKISDLGQRLNLSLYYLSNLRSVVKSEFSESQLQNLKSPINNNKPIQSPCFTNIIYTLERTHGLWLTFC